MKVILDGDPKEIADLVLALQGQRNLKILDKNEAQLINEKIRKGGHCLLV